ncbi:hypothetical protein ACP4OV_027069 [Aristida adscensionis]
MRGHADLFNEVDLHGMAQAAVRRAAGRCEAFWGEYAGDDAFLLFLADQAPSLKSLRLISCYDVSNEGFTEAIKRSSLCLRSLSFHFATMYLGRMCLRLLGNHVHNSSASDSANTDSSVLKKPTTTRMEKPWG